MAASLTRFNPTHRIALAMILFVALALRLGWALSRPAGMADAEVLSDQKGYLLLAQSLLRGEGLKYVDDRFGQIVYAMRLPGYPLFLAACRANARVARGVQAVLDASVVLAIYLLTRRWVPFIPSPGTPGEGEGGGEVRESAPSPTLPRRTGRGRNDQLPCLTPLLSAALVAVHPFLIYFTGLLLTETLFTALLAWAFVLLSRRRTLLWGIALLALSVHVRPSAVFLPAIAGAVAGWMRAIQPPQRSRWEMKKKALAMGGVGALLTVLVLVPWAWRNHQILGRWLWSSTNDGFTAYDGFHPAATGASDQSFVKQMPELAAMTELQRSDFLAAKARDAMRANPERFVGLTFRKLLRTWSPVPLSREYGTRLYVAVGLLFCLPFDVLTIAGLCSRRLPGRVKLFLVLPALYFTVVHALSVGSLRYRVPAEPLLAVLVAVGFTASLEAWWARRRAASSPFASATETPATPRSER